MADDTVSANVRLVPDDADGFVAVTATATGGQAAVDLMADLLDDLDDFDGRDDVTVVRAWSSD